MAQFIRYSRTCNSYQDFLHRSVLLTRKLLSQGFIETRLRPTLKKFLVVTIIWYSLIVCQWPPWLMIRHLGLHDGCRMRCRKCLPLRSTWYHPLVFICVTLFYEIVFSLNLDCSFYWLLSIYIYIYIFCFFNFIYIFISNSLENILMNHWPECILNWHGTFLGQEHLIVQMNSLGHKWPLPRKGSKRSIFKKVLLNQ